MARALALGIICSPLISALLLGLGRAGRALRQLIHRTPEQPMTNPLEELTTAAETLRAVAPQITPPFEGLADPVADWLEHARATAIQMHGLFADSERPEEFIQPHALAVARAINGSQP